MVEQKIEKKNIEWGDNLTQRAVKNLGFSDEMIKQLLPKPMLAQNPYGNFSQMKLWKKKDVYRVMKSKEFLKMKVDKLNKSRSRVVVE